MMMFIIWCISILMLLASIGGIIKLSSQGFNWTEFISLLVVMIILVVFATIALTGSYTV
jgi:hypothetical protein